MKSNRLHFRLKKKKKTIHNTRTGQPLEEEKNTLAMLTGKKMQHHWNHQKTHTNNNKKELFAVSICFACQYT